MSEVAAEASDPEVRHASTVLLVRDGDRGVEVFMEKRHIKSDFVGGAYVFPGGRVDPEDEIPPRLCHGLSDEQASRQLRVDHGGLAFYTAAVRECFEEAGILLAYDQRGELLDFTEAEREERYRGLRDQLNSSSKGLLEIAEERGLTLATDRIYYWAHWITPEGQPKRYDTRFFIARAPDGQTAAHDDWELTHSAWVTPKKAIQKSIDREWMIIFPTMKNLLQLDALGSADAAIEWARGDHERPVMQPRILGEKVLLPGDPGYDEAERDVSKVSPGIFFKQFQKQSSS